MPLVVEANHWLSGDARRVESVRHTALEVPTPLGIVWHWTAGRCTTPAHADNLVAGIRTYDKGKDVAASWHVLIAKDGRLFQSVPFNQGSWHVGRPGRIGGLPAKTVDGTWNATTFPAVPGSRLFGNINRGTVGVELENSGRLMHSTDGKFYCWPYWVNPDAPAGSGVLDKNCEVSKDRAVQLGGEFYDVFPPAQVASARDLLKALVVKYKWTREVSQYGHLMFDPGRKEDPGPLWLGTTLPGILDELFGGAQRT